MMSFNTKLNGGLENKIIGTEHYEFYNTSGLDPLQYVSISNEYDDEPLNFIEYL